MPAPYLHEKPSKKGVQWGLVNIGARGSGALSSGPSGGHAGGVHSAMKYVST
jgi:hypothetical protein